MKNETGWVSHSSSDAGTSRSVKEQTAIDEQRHARETRRGRLLARVEIEVYEHEAVPQLFFPNEAALGPDTPSDVIADVVERARQQLSD